MLSLKNVRFEILRDPIVRDFSMDLQPGEVKTLFGPSVSISRKSSIRKSHCHAEYRHFYG